MLKRKATGDPKDIFKKLVGQGRNSKHLQVVEKTEPKKTSYELVTVPDIQRTWNKLTGLAEDFRGALASVKKIEHIIYPLLTSKQQFLADPDPAVIEDLKKVNQQVEWLVSQARAQPEAIISKLKAYLKYAQISYDQMIFEMKNKILED